MPPLFLQFSDVKKYLETISVHPQIFLRTKWSRPTSYTTYDLPKVPGAEILVPVLHFLSLPRSTEYTFSGEKKHTTWTQVLKKSNPNSLVCGLEGKILRM